MVSAVILHSHKQKRGLIIPNLEWTAPLVPNLHVSPLGLLTKKGKQRLIFDASFRPHPSRRRWPSTTSRTSPTSLPVRPWRVAESIHGDDCCLLQKPFLESELRLLHARSPTEAGSNNLFGPEYSEGRFRIGYMYRPMMTTSCTTQFLLSFGSSCMRGSDRPPKRAIGHHVGRSGARGHCSASGGRRRRRLWCP